MSLKVGQAAEKIEVTTEAPLVETLTGAISGLVDDQEIRDLPLNARSLDQLISLESSAPIFRNGNHALPSGSELTYIVHGGRDQMNQFLLDGMEMLGAYSYGTQPGGALGYNEGVMCGPRNFRCLRVMLPPPLGRKAELTSIWLPKQAPTNFMGPHSNSYATAIWTPAISLIIRSRRSVETSLERASEGRFFKDRTFSFSVTRACAKT